MSQPVIAAPPAPPSAEPAMPRDEGLYEFVEGRWVEKAMAVDSILIVTAVTHLLRAFARQHGLGRVASEMLFRIHPAGGPKRRPDVAFVSYERWSRERAISSEEAWDVVPDLAVEVVSPTNAAEDVVAKVREYFEAGVRRVWVVYPSERLVYVYTTPQEVRIVGPAADLDDAELLPGFRLPLAELFEDLPPLAEGPPR